MDKVGSRFVGPTSRGNFGRPGEIAMVMNFPTLSGAAAAAMRALLRTMGPLVAAHDLWRPGDQVVIGLSGGKDSFVLLHLLSHPGLTRLPPCRLLAIHVPPPEHCPCRFSAQAIQEWFDAVPGVELIRTAPTAPGTIDCESCARERRRRLFEACAERGVTTLAFAHHQDDLVQTYLLNVLFHGETSGTMLPCRSFMEGRIRLIRPLLTTPEKRILAVARRLGFPLEAAAAHTQQHGKRAQLRDFLMGLGSSRDTVKRNLARLAIRDWPGLF
jgi:tRNA 2-thiocytidine biosynthesis protein TtcA